MTRGNEKSALRAATAKGRGGLLALVAMAAAAASAPALAQGWFQWPWSTPEERPVPREPVYRPPGQLGPPPVAQPGQPPGGAWGTKNPICLQLEERLVQEGQRGNQSRDMMPMVENELRQVDQAYRDAQAQLDRFDCYDYFLFSKTLRQTRRCTDLANEAETKRRRLADLETQRQQLASSAGRSYQDDIIRELARNNCGATYTQQARREDNGWNPFWQDEESSGSGGLGNYSNLPYSTYRTVCVRLCDGYYFPISFSTLPNHFQRDAEQCQSKCAAPAELYYYQNPGGAVDQMVAAKSNEPYTQLKTAFRYRKEFVQGCSCKTAEYVPEAGAPQQQGEAAPQPGAASEQRAEGPAENLPWRPR
jgi:hypothetical protein